MRELKEEEVDQYLFYKRGERMRSSTVDIILKTSVTEVKHRPLRIVLGWGTKVVD